jgi:hypothetical protein
MALHRRSTSQTSLCRGLRHWDASLSRQMDPAATDLVEIRILVMAIQAADVLARPTTFVFLGSYEGFWGGGYGNRNGREIL